MLFEQHIVICKYQLKIGWSVMMNYDNSLLSSDREDGLRWIVLSTPWSKYTGILLAEKRLKESNIADFLRCSAQTNQDGVELVINTPIKFLIPVSSSCHVPWLAVNCWGSLTSATKTSLQSLEYGQNCPRSNLLTWHITKIFLFFPIGSENSGINFILLFYLAVLIFSLLPTPLSTL